MAIEHDYQPNGVVLRILGRRTAEWEKSRVSLHVQSLDIPDVKIISPMKHGDSRGYFSETYNKKAFAEAGIILDFVQDNHSLSPRVGTLRGLHYQGHPFAQDKLVRVVSGRILDVAVDIRRASPTYGKWVTAEISAENWNQILVPVGFAHGICTLEPNTQLIYKVTNYYSPQNDFGIRWNDPDLRITWPFPEDKIVLSDKDKRQPFFKDVVSGF
jgi:dTDP-4-dehydrorhamnose 3,5-epimerase